ncbi:very short patch repair endonuclease [Chloroflexota bacterium]
MADIYTKTKRSQIMSHISDRDSKMEISVRKALFSAGFRYRKNVKSLPGKPDIVLPKYKTVIFTHGCFWHGHEGCKASKLPETRREFWENKIRDNVERDKRNINPLEQNGWKVIVLWQCELNNELKHRRKIAELIGEIKGISWSG